MDNHAGERVEIRAASKSYGSVRALNAVSLDIAPREFVSLLGPSGSGKTTLLGILGGFIVPSAGSIHIGGRDVTLTPPHKRNIGFVFQNYALFPHMSVGDNVAFALRARRLPKSTWDARVRAALAMVDLSGYEDRGIAQLSGGQRQRVAVARAIVFEPRLILMDEPLSALDKQLRESMQMELRQLHRRLGATIVYVTHDQREALTMSDRVAVLKDGMLVQVGSPSQLHNQPANAFIAGFIGEATLIAVTRLDAGTVCLSGAPLRTRRPIPAEGPLVLAVQTEKLLIDDGSGEPDRNRFSGCVKDVVYQGESLRIFITLPDATQLSLRQPSHFAATRRIPPVGAPIALSLHPEDTIVVAAGDGANPVNAETI
ncbi:MAG TPA: ABC transporter ATP-binding protein [Hyphomicrobiaceae bacterium]|jgi:putative spermidine/putrescine transport system ATP-binding protein|nr:ABC transporter ATP-binding protein [Hyphomicrobiaceae bacterium]